MNTHLSDLGAHIKHRRVQKNLTIEALAKRVDLSKSMVSQIENGINYPSFQSLIGLAKVLSINLNDVVNQKLPKKCPRCRGAGFLG